VRVEAIAFVAALVGLFAPGASRADGFDWTPFEQEDVIQVLTHDEDGELRDTTVWVVVLDGSGYVRTNASRWLENIQRNPEVQVRVRGYDYLMRAEEVRATALRESVEGAYKKKYGLLQRTMSLFRFREPTVLRLVPRSSALPGSR
jgi:hypothetical protein